MATFIFTYSVVNKFNNVSVYDEHAIVGFLMWDGAEDGRIEDLYVTPDYRRKGLATKLWNEATEYATNNNLATPAHSETRTLLGDLWAKTMPYYFETEGIIESYTD